MPKCYISLIDENDEIVINYQDNGIGVAPNDIKNLFRPFVRIKNSLNQEGTGIGLYVVSKIIYNYKGTIKAESELGKGIKFNIRLPKQLPQTD